MDNELKVCAFCKEHGVLRVRPFAPPSRMIFGVYDVFIECTNAECGVKPRTKVYSAVYGNSVENAKVLAIQEWNEIENQANKEC